MNYEAPGFSEEPVVPLPEIREQAAVFGGDQGIFPGIEPDKRGLLRHFRGEKDPPGT